MNKELVNKIYDKITEFSKIIICRHIRPDGDCVGASLGLKQVLKDSFPEKEIYVINEDKVDYLKFLGEEDEEKDEEFYKDALVIVVDTGSQNRVSNKFYNKGAYLIKIDHHIEMDPYGDISWVEEEKSSVCEMIAEFCFELKVKLVLSKNAATCIYTGIVTDSGRFMYSTCGETLRNASTLLDVEIDTETLFANLYLKKFDYLKLQGEIYKTIKMTESGVAYIYISKKLQKKYNLTHDEASNMISVINQISGSLIWIAFIENQNDNSIRVRLRSRFVDINTIAEHYRGGGHAKASGATVYNKKEIKALLAEANQTIKEYKENNTGWL